MRGVPTARSWRCVEPSIAVGPYATSCAVERLGGLEHGAWGLAGWSSVRARFNALSDGTRRGAAGRQIRIAFVALHWIIIGSVSCARGALLPQRHFE